MPDLFTLHLASHSSEIVFMWEKEREREKETLQVLNQIFIHGNIIATLSLGIDVYYAKRNTKNFSIKRKIFYSYVVYARI